MNDTLFVLITGFALGQVVRLNPTPETQERVKRFSACVAANSPTALRWLSDKLGLLSPTERVQALFEEVHESMGGSGADLERMGRPAAKSLARRSEQAPE